MNLTEAITVLTTIRSEHGELDVRLIEHDHDNATFRNVDAVQIAVQSSETPGEKTCVLILNDEDADMLYEGKPDEGEDE